MTIELTPVKYMRADLVAALIKAAKPYVSPVQNADYKRQLRQHEALVAAITAMEDYRDDD